MRKRDSETERETARQKTERQRNRETEKGRMQNRKRGLEQWCARERASTMVRGLACGLVGL